MKTLVILLFSLSLSFPQTFKSIPTSVSEIKQVSIDTKVDTVVKKEGLTKDENDKEALKKENKKLRKELNRLNAIKAYKIHLAYLNDLRAKKKRVYFVVCDKDTAKLRKDYKIKVSGKWNRSRASLDSICRIIEKWLKKAKVKDIKQAYKDSVIKQYGIWPNKMKRLYKYINNAKNGFIKKEIK